MKIRLLSLSFGIALLGMLEAQPPPPPGGFPTGPRPVNGCLSPDGRLIPPANLVDIHLSASATGAFSVELSWNGPEAQYRISGGANAIVDSGPTLQPAGLDIPDLGRVPDGAVPTTGQPQIRNYRYQHARPAQAVLPDFDYSYLVTATFPDGKYACAKASARTQAAPIVALPSGYLGLDEFRLGFVLPAYAAVVNVYLENYSDGQRKPGHSQIASVPRNPPQDSPVRFELTKPVRRASNDSRLKVNPGFPPLPADYERPLVYDFTVEAVWLDDAGKPGRNSRTQILVDGPMPLTGCADLHTHPMSHLAFGGKLFHGAPDADPNSGSLLPAVQMPNDPRCRFDQRAVSMEEALSDDAPTHGDALQSQCGDFVRKGLISVLESTGPKGVPAPGHRSGAPDFQDWPTWNDMTHQKMWIDWIKRAYDGGLRVMVALSHNNRALADIAKGRNCTTTAPVTCVTGDKESSELQIAEMKAFVTRHSDFMEVASSAADIYSIVGANKLAVVLGAEIDNIGNLNRDPQVTETKVRQEIRNLCGQGVRYIFPVHVSDNLFGATAIYEDVFNFANFYETGHYWLVGCSRPEDEIGFTLGPLSAAALFVQNNLTIPPGALPSAPDCQDLGHKNNLPGLTQLGRVAINEMMKLGMIIDIDHMSNNTAEEALGIAETVDGGGYPLMSGHTGIRKQSVKRFNAENSRTAGQLARVACLQGMFGLGTSQADAYDWANQYDEAVTLMTQVFQATGRCANKLSLGQGSVALGTDTNSLVPAPRPTIGPDLKGPIRSDLYKNLKPPLNSRSQSGTRTWDYNQDGVAHYGMFADFLQDAAMAPLISGRQILDNHLYRNADYFWRMWLRIESQKSKVQ